MSNTTMSNTTTPELDARIRRVLGALRWRIRAYVWLEGLALAVVWLGLMFWAALAVDYLPILVGASELSRAFRAIVLLIVAVVVAVLGLVLAGVMVQTLRMRERIRKRLDHAANHDPLTGCLNRRGLRQAVEDLPYADAEILLIDLDDFKKLNDTLGHDAGDAVLAQVRPRLSPLLRESDLLCRWGGEEFLVVRRGDAQERGSGSFGERIRRCFADQPMNLGQTESAVTVSIGSAPLRPGMPFAEVLRAADQALLEAKRQGKNRHQANQSSAQPSPSERLARKADWYGSDAHGIAPSTRVGGVRIS